MAILEIDEPGPWIPTRVSRNQFNPFGATPALDDESKDPFGAKGGNQLTGA